MKNKKVFIEAAIIKNPLIPGCERFGEPSNILLCWKKLQRGHHQPGQVRKKNREKQSR